MSQTTTETVVDVRPLAPREKHPTIFGVWNQLPEGGAMILINDHDPVPLYYQFACEHSGAFKWEYLESGPEVWRVRISKGKFSDPGFVPSSSHGRGCSHTAPVTFAEPIVVDTRPIFAKGETPCQVIDEAVEKTIPGQSFILLVPFEPAPLYAKLSKQGFSHTTTRLEDGTFKVEFKRNS